jgi:hypothetical protein
LEIFASKVYVLKENGLTLQHIINRIYSFKTQINNSIINEHKHINTTNDKGVHPSLWATSPGPASNGSLLLIAQSAKKHALQCSN